MVLQVQHLDQFFSKARSAEVSKCPQSQLDTQEL